MADFAVRGEVTLDTSKAEQSASGVSNKLGNALDKSAGKVGGASSTMQTAMNALSVAAGNALSQLAEYAVQAVATIVETGLEFNRQMENYQLAFENLLGSAEAAQDALDAIKEDAAATPFDVAGLVSANRLLISTGQSAEQARQVIIALGNAVSASGGGNDELQRMAANLQQIANVGEAAAIDIKQFAYAGIDIYGILSDYTGKTREEVQELTVSYDLLAEALKAASAEGGRYAGAMEAYSKTLQGRMDTLADNAAQLAGALTEPLFDAQKDLVAAASGWVDTLSATLEAEGPAAMMQAGLDIVLAIYDGIVTNLPNILVAAQQLHTEFLTGIMNRLPEIGRAGGEIMGKLIAGVLQMGVQLASAAVQLVETFAIQFFTFEWLDVGINIVQGIIDGFLSAVPRLAQTVWDSVTNIGKAASAAAQAASDNVVVQFTAPPSVKDTTNPYHRGSVKDEDYYKRLGQHYTDTGQDQKQGDYATAAEKDAAAAYDFSAALDKAAASAGKAAKQTETLADKLADAHSALRDSQSAYDTLRAAVEEYNASGEISLATWQDLMGLAPAYQALLTQEGDKLRLNEEAYAALSAAQRQEVEALALQQGATAETIGLLDRLLVSVSDTGAAFDALKEQLDSATEGLDTRASVAALEYELWAETVGASADEAEALQAKLDSLAEQQDIQAQVVQQVEQAYADVCDAYGVTSDEAIQLREVLLEEQLAYAELQTEIDATTAALTESQDAMTRYWEAAQEGLEAAGGVSNAISDLGRSLTSLETLMQEGLSTDSLGSFLTSVGDGVGTVLSLVDSVSGLGSALSKLGGQLLPSVASGVVDLLGAVDNLVPGLDLASYATAFFNAVLNANPIVLVISMIAALAVALFGLGQTNTKIGEQIRQTWYGIVDTYREVFKTIFSLFQWWINAQFWAWNLFVRLVGHYIGLKEVKFDFTSWIDDIPAPQTQTQQEQPDVEDYIPDVEDYKAYTPDYSANTSALEDNTEALEEQNELLRNPPRYQSGESGPLGAVVDYAALLDAAQRTIWAQGTRLASNYDVGGTTAARLNASWQGTSTTVIEMDGREVARATAPYMDEELAF